MAKSRRRPTKTDAAHEAAVQDYMHQSTPDITRKRTMLTTENSFLEREIAELSGRLIDAKLKLSQNEAMLRGLAFVVGLRQQQS
jgi:hypothetical protein